MVISVVAVGRIRDPALRQACDAYAGRVRRYLKLDVREVREAGRGAAGRRDEGEALLRAAGEHARLVALTRTGRVVDSADFAALLAEWREAARDVALLIGGAHGLSDRLVERAETTLSLSSLTMPHDVARLVTLEQLYRACTILRGEPYHKAPR